jgi:glycerophosphoryl diester phosphodiesterase
MPRTFLVALLVIFYACKKSNDSIPPTNNDPLTGFDIQGHRGCRGLMPENTIPAMLKAVDLGVHTLEMDLFISKDSQVVVSHDPYFDSDFCLDPDGKPIFKNEEYKHLLYWMNYNDIRKWDVGSKFYPAFPAQAKIKTYKPLLSELIDSVEQYIATKQLHKVRYSIEIKSTILTDSILHPIPSTFVRLVMNVIKSKGIENRVIVSSFDRRPLKLIAEQSHAVQLSYISMNKTECDPEVLVKNLGFVPDQFCAYYGMLTADAVSAIQNKGAKVIAWTVNDLDNFNKVKNMGVSGIITDYPDRIK